MKTSEYILKTAREYAIYVCDQRALPRITDGLKSVQRKALWVAKKHSEKIKTISLAGEMISSGLYVHGDSSASQAISLMAGKYCNNVCWLEGYGAFGTIVDPKSFGAPRYTYVKISKEAKDILLIDEDVIPMQENYDGSEYEPSTFLPLIPVVLLNGISGIAIGWATDILPHSLIDIIDATLNVLKGKKIKNLIPCYKNYDIEIEEKSPLFYVMKGKFERLNKNTIKILSLPPEMTIETIKNHLSSLIEKNMVIDYEDLSTEKIDIRVRFKRNILENHSDEELLKMLKMETTKHERIVVIDFDGTSINQYETHEELIKKFILWRKKFLVKRYEKKISDINKEIKKIECFLICYENKFPQKLMKLKNKDIDELMKKILGSNMQQYFHSIKNIPVYRWNNEEYEKNKQQLHNLEEEKKKYQYILQNEKEIDKIYEEELVELKRKYMKYWSG